MSEEDRLFAEAGTARDFAFDERVVRVFPDMIGRSVPGYGLVVPMIGLLARRYAQPGSRLYDLGCSLGATALAMREAVSAPVREIVAVDNSRAMIERLGELLAGASSPDRPAVRPVLADVQDVAIEDASVVALTFTLQFVEPAAREGLLRRIHDGLRPGGVLLLAEKLRFDSAVEQRLMTEWHHDFKRAQGYSELEIAGKRDALENVLRPDSLPAHRQRLADCGFAPVLPWFQAFPFVALAAFRPDR